MPKSKEQYTVKYYPIRIGRDDTSEEREVGPLSSWRAAMREVNELERYHASNIRVLNADGKVVFKN